MESAGGFLTESANLAATAEEFLSTYRDAFQRRDLDAVTRSFGDDVYVVSDTGATVRSELIPGARWRSVVAQLFSQYHALGVADIKLRDVSSMAVSRRLVLVKVTWVLYDGAQEQLYDFCATYTLERAPSSWRILAIAHNEVSRYREYSSDRSDR